MMFAELRDHLETQAATIAAKLTAIDEAEAAFAKLQAVFGAAVGCQEFLSPPKPNGRAAPGKTLKNSSKSDGKTYPECGAGFSTVKHGAKRVYCSDSCRTRAGLKRAAGRATSSAPEQAKRVNEIRAAEAAGNGAPPLAEIRIVDHVAVVERDTTVVAFPERKPEQSEQPSCAYCDEPFAPNHPEQRYCTRDCKVAAREARRGGIEVPGDPFGTRQGSAYGASPG